MPIQNDFLTFATGPGANVVDQATYASLTALTTGFLSGTAQSIQLNKVWRQSSIMSAVVAQFIVAQTGQPAVDDGTTATLLANFTKAVNAASKQRVILTDTGSANAYAAANSVPMTSLPTVSGVVQTISVKTSNTGASTYSPDGLASRPIFGLGGVALQGGEMLANGIATLMSYVGPLLNGGALCWVLFECIGGAQQVAPATQSAHALQAGQALGLFLGVQVFTSSGTYTPGVYTVGGRSVTATKVRKRICGGGGGGGAVPATTSAQVAAANGGNGGEYKEWIGPATTENVTIGAGGAGGVAGFNGGSNGGTTTAGSISAVGGNGGGAGGAGAPPYINLQQANNGGGVIGAVAGGVLTVWRGCSLGGYGLAVSTAALSGGTAGAIGGSGGDSPFSPTFKGSAAPSAGQYGAGGGGISIGASSSASAGLQGQQGVVIYEEYA